MSDIDLEFGNNPTIEGLIKFAFNSMITGVHTAIPGHIIDYDTGSKLATVQIDIMQKKDGKYYPIPPLTGVPIMLPRTNAGDAFLSLPIKNGDSGLILFSERSIDAWIVEGGTVNPKDIRKHDLSDAMFYPGLYPATKPVDANNDDVVLQNIDMKLSLAVDGRFSAGNKKLAIPSIVEPIIPGTPAAILTQPEELVNIIYNLVDTLLKSFVSTPYAWAPPAPPFPAVSPLGYIDPVTMANLQTIKNALDDLKL